MSRNLDFKEIIDYLRNYQGNIKIMEVCGTHTSSIFKNSIRTVISDSIKLVSGPGCPVCVTPRFVIDELTEYAKEAEVLSFGDMFRVPGSNLSCLSLAEAKAQGGQVRLMYSPFEVLKIAKEQPENKFIVAAVGFETTAPVYAALIEAMIFENIKNVKIYTALKTMPEVLDYVCASEEIDAFLCPGHVSAVIGSAAYEPLCEKYKKPFVIAGFEAEHILAAIYEIVRQKENGRYKVKNLYPSVVTENGQTKALELLDRYFEKTDSVWRGIGEIKNSGYKLKNEYSWFSANEFIYDTVKPIHESEPDGCRCTDVILGRISPNECGLFGTVCTFKNPVGACMVSSEGACGIWSRGR